MEKGKLNEEEQCFQFILDVDKGLPVPVVCTKCGKFLGICQEDSEYEYFCDDCEI